MIELLRNIFSKSKSDSNVQLEFNGNIKFVLKIEDLIIGYLVIENGEWVFNYSDDFRAQNTYRRLAGFSDLNKTYKSRLLWPFFKIRIPGLNQPMIREIIERENIDKDNEAILLQRFGKLTMTNPYVLEKV